MVQSVRIAPFFKLIIHHLNIKYMKRIDYRGRTISQVESGVYNGKYLVEYEGVCLVCDRLESAKKVVDAKLEKYGYLQRL